MMNNKPLIFELISILLLLGAGGMLLLSNLPGWGLITIAGLLSILSFGLRKPSSSTATSQLTIKGHTPNAT